MAIRTLAGPTYSSQYSDEDVFHFLPAQFILILIGAVHTQWHFGPSHGSNHLGVFPSLPPVHAFVCIARGGNSSTHMILPGIHIARSFNSISHSMAFWTRHGSNHLGVFPSLLPVHAFVCIARGVNSSTHTILPGIQQRVLSIPPAAITKVLLRFS